MSFPDPPAEAAPDDAVLGIDIGAHTVKTGVIGPDLVVVDHVPTATVEAPWGIDRLCAVAADLHAAATTADRTPANLTVNANGQVDEYHGAVQFSPNLSWHDVAVAGRVADAVPCEVLVRHSVRAAALAESNLGAARGDAAMLFVALGVGVAAAGASSGMVVADHVGAGEIGRIRIRSGAGEGRTLEEFVSAPAIARRYAERTGGDPRQVTAAEVHARSGSDPDAARVWGDTVEALADGLEWATMLFAPETLVLGGGLANAGDDLVTPVAEAVKRRFGDGRAPAVRLAAFGENAGLVGAVLTGWRRARWPVEQLDIILDALRNRPGSVDRAGP